MTPGDAYAILVNRGVSEELASQVRLHLGQLDEAMYRPDAQVSPREAACAIAEALCKIEKEVVR
jgi:hypothetical protein